MSLGFKFNQNFSSYKRLFSPFNINLSDKKQKYFNPIETRSKIRDFTNPDFPFTIDRRSNSNLLDKKYST